MRQPKPWHARRRLVASLLCGGVLCWILCATGCATGTARIETVPLCPPWTAQAIEGYAVMLNRADPVYDGLIRHIEDADHFCRFVLPAWRGR